MNKKDSKEKYPMNYPKMLKGVFPALLLLTLLWTGISAALIKASPTRQTTGSVYAGNIGYPLARDRQRLDNVWRLWDGK